MSADKKKPWMKWYARDWRGDGALRMCGYAARGLWADLLTLIHDEGDPYGHLVINGLRPTSAQLSRMLGGSAKEIDALLSELEAAGVFSRTDTGAIFSRRMVRDMAKAERDRINGKGGGNPNLKPPDNPTDGEGVNPPDKAQKPEARGQSSSLRSEEGSAPAERPARQAKRAGTRLPEDWQPSPSEIEYARSQGLGEQQIARSVENFRDYWTVGKGRNTTHADWTRAWQGWVRTDSQRNAGASNGTGFGRKPSGAETLFAAAAEVARDGADHG